MYSLFTSPQNEMSIEWATDEMMKIIISQRGFCDSLLMDILNKCFALV